MPQTLVSVSLALGIHLVGVKTLAGPADFETTLIADAGHFAAAKTSFRTF